MENQKLVRRLSQAPRAELRLISLIGELTLPGGTFDMETATARTQELEEAHAETAIYVSATHRLANKVKCLLHRHPD